MTGAGLPTVVQASPIEPVLTSARPVRIHLGPMPPMRRRIVCDLLSAEPDLVVVGSSGADEEPLEQARRQLADMMIMEDRRADGTSTLDLIISGPLVSIFAIAPDGQTAAAVDFIRRPINLDTGRKAAFADAIRSLGAGLRC